MNGGNELYLDKAKARLEELKLLAHDEVSPCTEEEVAALEKQLNIHLPGAYREFLLWMGRDGGNLLVGTDYSYEILPKLKSWAMELLSEKNLSHLLPDDAFVFLMHQGYQFMFFRLSEGEDPPIYYYNQPAQQQSFVVSDPSFSAFMLGLIEDSA